MVDWDPALPWIGIDLWGADVSLPEQFISTVGEVSPPPVPQWRYIAQNIVTGQIVHTNLPLKRDSLQWDLSGPGSLTGTISPVIPELIINGEPILQEWQSAIYAEADGHIRWGGLLRNSNFAGAVWTLEAAGFASYPQGIPYTGPDYSKINFDPTQIFQDIWDHLQSQPDGNLGLAISGVGSPIRVGVPAIPPTTSEEEATEAEPYQLLWWENIDCGGELDKLAAETPFDYVEEHSWSSPTSITHRIRLGFPRIGAKRDDLVFIQGANVTQVVEGRRNGDDFTNGVFGLGKGEGAAMVRAEDSVRDGRLRRPTVYADQSIDTPDRLRALIGRQRTARQLKPQIASLTVMNHPNAPIGSWSVGDDIRVLADMSWLGWCEIWCRITSWELASDSVAVLTVARSDSFTYGGQSYEVIVVPPPAEPVGGESEGGTGGGVFGWYSIQDIENAYAGKTLANIAADFPTIYDIERGPR